MGYLERVGTGTLFVDEIGRMSIRMQEHFLQVLEERIFCRVGSTEARPFRGKIVAATNAGLQAGLKRGAIRRDFFDRMNAGVFILPPLVERIEDIEPLLDHLIERRCAKSGVRLELGVRARRLMRSYTYPGQVREMKQIVGRLVALRLTRPVTPEDILPLPGPFRPKRKSPTSASFRDLKAALEQTGGNVAAAANVAGMHRVSAHRKLRQVPV